MTGARWIRGFVRGHESYKGDSVVGERTCFDMIKVVEKLGMGNGEGVPGAEKLLGRYRNKR